MGGQRRGVRRAGWMWSVTALVLATAASQATAATGPAYVVRDLTTGTEPGASSYPSSFVDIGHTTLFFAYDPAHGFELWRTDGTADGTVLVKDTVPGPGNAITSVGHAVGDGVLYFWTGESGLWRSDGSADGTFKLADIRPQYAVVDGDRLYAAVDFDYDGFELVRVDLPSATTTLLGEFRGGEIVPSLTMVAGRLFFAAVGRPEGLWTSDGTAEGTRLVRAVRLANREANHETHLIAVGGQLFFIAHDEAGWELWRSDGSEAGTYRVRDIEPGPAGSIHLNDYSEARQPFFAVLDDVLVFLADDGVSGLEPWRSDGSEAGTVRIADVWPGRRGIDGTEGDDDHSDTAEGILRLVAFDGRLFFTARSRDGGPLELWVTGGTAASTAPVAPIAGFGNLGAVVADSRLIYVSGYSGLWVSDGTTAGSGRIANIDQVHPLSTSAGGVVFSARHEAAGFEPWISDGTAAGTRLLADLARGLPGLDPQHLTDLGGTLLFSADDGERGRELWRSDGTTAGTRLVADIVPGAAGSFPVDLVTSGATLYFMADDGQGLALWRSDGTARGTVRVGGPAKVTHLAGDGRGGVFFFAAEPTRGSFWYSDGTPDGARLLRAGDTELALEYHVPAVALGDIALVALPAPTPGAGFALWRTDGTVAGTVSLGDHAVGSVPAVHFVRLGDALLFFVNRENDATLWRTDGTAAGTREIAPIGGKVYRVADGDDGRIYFNALPSWQRYRLWQSDGTAAGTFAVSSALHVNPIQVAAGPRTFTITSWPRRTAFGEVGCVDLLETVDAFSTFAALARFGDRLLFTEPLPSGARRLWSSDGTRTGTVAVDELPAPAVPGNVAPLQFVRSGGRVFFAARQGDSGSELWAVPLSAVPRVGSAPCEIPPTPTPVPERTPRPFECPVGTHCTVLEIEPVGGRAGERVTISAVLHARDLPIAGVQNDLTLPAGMVVLENDEGRPACTVDPSIDKGGTSFAFQPPGCTPGEDCAAVRALVFALDNVDPIYDGAVLYRCELLLANDLEPGDYALALSNLGASDPDGGAVQLDGIDGVVSVEDQSGTRPIDAGAAGGDGCQTVAPHGAIAAVWPLLAALIPLRRRRHRV